MACMVMAYVVMTYGLSEFGLSFFYILYRDVLYGHGTCSYGLCAGVADAGHACPMPSSRSYGAYILACIAYAVMADLVMACAQGSPTLAMSDAEQSELWPMYLWPV